MLEAQRQTWPVPIATSSGVTGATLVWRWQGRLHLTVVVKATLALVPGGVMTLVAPEPIATDEQDDGAVLRTAGDLAPFRRLADVVVTGHAFVPPGPGAGVSVRFTVLRDGVAVLDKSLSRKLSGDAPAGPGRVRLFGLGPLSRRWPVRSRLLGEHDARRFEGESIDLPSELDESYFQAAPLDQRLEILRGDEGIVFDGAPPQGARIESRLPGVHAVARLHRAEEPGEGEPIDLVMDTLHLDLDQATCNVTWRGTTSVERREELASMDVVAAIEIADAPSPRHAAPFDEDSLDRRIFPGVVAAHDTPPPVSSPRPGLLAPQPSLPAEAEQSPFEATAILPPELDPAVIRAPSPPVVAEPSPLDATTTALVELAPPSAPFPSWAAGAAAPVAKPLPAPVPPPIRTSPRSLPPIPTPPSRAAEEHPLDATSFLDHAAALDLAAKPAIPFDSARGFALAGPDGGRPHAPGPEDAPIEEMDASHLEDIDSVDDLRLDLEPHTFPFTQVLVDPRGGSAPVSALPFAVQLPAVAPPFAPLVRRPPAVVPPVTPERIDPGELASPNRSEVSGGTSPTVIAGAPPHRPGSARARPPRGLRGR